MGAGIAEVFARTGYAVVGVEKDDDAPGPRPAVPRALDDPRGEAGEDDRGRAGRAARAGSPSPPRSRTSPRPTSWSRRSWSRWRPRRRSSASSTRSSARTRSSPPTPRACRSPRSRPPTPAPAGSSACTSSTRRRCSSSSRSCAPSSPRSRCSSDVKALMAELGKTPVVCGDKAGFIANTLLFGYLNHAVVDVRGPLRHPRGHRRRDALRLRLPDGPAGAARPDRPRHGVRDPRDDVPPGPRPPARPVADPQADGHRRLARPQDRPRLLHLRGARTARSSSRTTGRRRPTRSRSCSHDIKQVGVVGTGTMATGIVEVFAKSGYDVLVRRPLGRQGRRRRRRDHQELRQADPARPLDRGGQGARCSAGSPAPPRSRTSRTSTSWSRRSPRTSRSRPRSSRTSTRSASPARSSRPRPRACRSSRAPGRPSGRRTSSGCTSSTRRRS